MGPGMAKNCEAGWSATQGNTCFWADFDGDLAKERPDSYIELRLAETQINNANSFHTGSAGVRYGFRP